jgi:hypothetical protein
MIQEILVCGYFHIWKGEIHIRGKTPRYFHLYYKKTHVFDNNNTVNIKCMFLVISKLKAFCLYSLNRSTPRLYVF